MARSKAPPTWMEDGPLPTTGIKQGISSEHRVKTQDPSTGPGAYGLSVARVLRVDYALFQVALHIINGESDLFQWSPIPATAPCAGARHFMGGLPEPGDLCVIGWLSTKPKTPVILAWLPIGVSSGTEWLPIQDFLPTEVDMNPKVLAHFEGIYSRRRHKMRQMRPGALLMSSSQGAEVLVDESVLITNRRATEIRLRDQDQAIVSRSLQQFQVMGGARLYGGMVQRDATFLPRRMFTDGTNWAAGIQEDASGDPLLPFELGETSDGELAPNAVFVRSDTSLPFADSGLEFDDNVDPYAFLARGLFIGVDGFALDPTKALSEAEYGGKPMLRVSIDPNQENTLPPVNGVIAEDITDSDTLTEYRIELDHTWDGRLPVSEQTDGLDVDRLPSDAVQENSTAAAGPYLQWVMGSVVGNDAFSRSGRDLYGLPLTPVIFEGPTVEPRMESAVGVPLGKHAATLFQLDPPNEDPSILPPTFISTLKDGSIRGFIGGPQNDNSIELALNGGMRIQSNGPMVFDSPNTILNFTGGDATNNFAAEINSDTGAIAIRGNAPTTQGSFSARTTSSDLQENNLPSVLVESPSGNVHVKSGRFTKISAANGIQLVDTNEVLVTSKQNINMFSDKVLIQANTLDKTVQGREVNAYSGPLQFLPTNAPLRETKFIATPFTGHAGGNTDEYTMLFGDRVENIRLGNHRTTILVGNMTYQTVLGQATVRAGANSMSVDSVSGIRMFSTTAINMTATATASITALASATIRSVGVTRVSGLSTTIGGVGKVGRILSSTDRDPLTNLPFAFFGLGSPGHRLGPPI